MTMHNRRWRLAPDAHGIPGQPAAIIPFPAYASKTNPGGKVRRKVGVQHAGHYQTGVRAGRLNGG